MADDTQLTILSDELIAIAAHELKSPLTAIRNIALYAAENPDRIIDDLNKIAQISERSLRVVHALLDNERLRSGQVQLEVEPVNLVTITHRVADILQPVLAQKNQQLRIYDRNLAPVYSDPQFVEQILYNLLDNAAKYSSAGQAIEVRFGMNGQNQNVRIRDYGVGISRSDWGKLFKKFGQLKQPMQHRADTTGLGLYICKQMSEHIGGQLFLQPRRVGSCFVLELPLMEQLDLWYGSRW